MIPGVAQAAVETILAQEKGAMERWRHGDPMGWAEITADEITYIEPDLPQHIRGLEAYRRYLGSLVGRVGYDGQGFITPRVAVYGVVAVLAYNYVTTVRGAGGEVVCQTPWNSTKVYASIEGKWRVIHTHWSYVRGGPPDLLEVSSPAGSAATECEGVLAELLSLERAAMERWCRGDPWGFAELSADEVTYFDADTARRIDGLQALRAEYAKQENNACYDVMEIVDPHIQVYGDAAVLSYRYLGTVLDRVGSQASRTPWNCTEVFVKCQRAWKIVHTHRSYVLGRRR